MTGEESFAEAVRTGLGSDPKAIDPKWLYDDRGSQLFERITELPEYYLTDRERWIFVHHADDIAGACAPDTGLVELGAGSAEKTRLIVDALVDRQGSTVYCPIDISPEALRMARQRFADDETVTVQPIEAGFVDGLRKLPEKNSDARLIAFIGSSIGNVPFEEQKDLLAQIASTMRGRDRFLLGTDMVKDVDTMLAAYDDSQGVTAEFTRNLLRRINRELDADFDLESFEHVVRFDEEKSAIMSYLDSQRDQDVRVDGLDLTVHFDEGELLHVEHSYKYTEEMVGELVDAAGLSRVDSWYDPDGWFGVHLLAPVEAV